MEWYQLKVSHIERLTKDSVRVDLFPVAYGSEDFSYKAGQYITFETNIDGEDVRRSYSLCSAPSENLLSVGIKEVEGGKFSTFANQKLKVGDILNAALPQGTFVNNEESQKGKQFVYFAAGSGITPILSMIKTTLTESPDSFVTLFFGNKSIRSIMFLEALEALKNTYIERFQVFHILSKQPQDSDMFNGRIDCDKLAQWDEFCFSIKDTDAFFLCGPEEMILSLKDELLTRGIDNSKIHFELFTTDSGDKARKARKVIEQNTADQKELEIILEGKRMTYAFNKDDDNILDRALMSGADLPFACKGGVCCTCKAKLEEGEVNMYVNYGLEQDEIDRGFILTCQSYPVTKKVLVNFDKVS